MASSHEKNKNVCLECSFCSDIFKEPKVLPCGHSFCRECLIKVMARNVRECPICRRKVTDIPSEGFPTNYVLKDIADAAIKHDEIRKNLDTSVEEFREKVSTICQGQNEKLQKWNKIRELLNVMVAKTFEITETIETMDIIDYCQRLMKDIEKMTKIIINIPSKPDHLQQTHLLSIFMKNRDNILIKNTNELAALAEDFSTVSLEDEPIGAMASSETNATQQETTSTQVLVTGGDNDFGLANSLEVYNPYNAANNRLLHSKLHDARCNHISAVIGDTVYVVGSRNYGSYKAMELFHSIHHQWLGYGPEMVEGRSDFAGVAIQGRLMVFGGYGRGYNPLSSCESFNSITQTWSPLPCMENARVCHCAVELDGQIYIMGGRINRKPSSSLSIFNPDATTWMSGPSMNQERLLAAAGKFDSSIVVTGGYDGIQTLKSCELLDPREQKWMNIAQMQQERRAHALVNFNGKLLAMGGWDMNWKALSTVEEYDPRANQWHFVESLVTERTEFAAVTVP